MGTRDWIKIHIGRVILKFKLKAFLAKVKFLDIVAMFSKRPDDPSSGDICFGIEYVIKLFDVKAILETFVY